MTGVIKKQTRGDGLVGWIGNVYFDNCLTWNMTVNTCLLHEHQDTIQSENVLTFNGTTAYRSWQEGSKY